MSSILGITSLPPELSDAIFDYLEPADPTGKGKGDLCACSLVSRAWSALVKPRIFRTITLTVRHPASWRRVDKVLDLEHRPNWGNVDGTLVPRRTLQDVHNFFSHFPTAASTVRDLKLVQFPSSLPAMASATARRLWSELDHWYSPDDDCPLELLIDVLSLLPRVSTLRLAYFLPRLAHEGRSTFIDRFIRSARGKLLSRTKTSGIVTRSSLGGLSTVTQLFIDLDRRDLQTGFNAAEARLDALLGYLSDLSELHIVNFTNFLYVLLHTERERFPHPYLRQQCRLKTLTLNNCTMRPSFFDAVRESPAADTLEVLDLQPTAFMTEPDMHAISASAALVKKVGPHLKTFTYWLDSNDSAIDLSTFAALQTLTLRLEPHLTSVAHGVLDKLQPIITSIPTSVERLHFQISTTMMSNPQEIITGFLRVVVELESTLARKVERGSLRELCFAFSGRKHQDVDLDGVCVLLSVPRPQLERLAALGIRV